MTDPYATLGVPRSASDDDIKRAFRAAALEAHPDRACGPGASPHARAAASARFAALTAAYEVLGDGEGCGEGRQSARACAMVAVLRVRRWGPDRVPPSHTLSLNPLSLFSLSPPPPAHKRRLFDLGGPSTSTASASYGTPTHSPFGGGWARRPAGRRPPPRPPGWWAGAARAVLARSTKGDALAHAALASLLLFGATALAGVADAAWGRANAGKAFEDAVAAVAEERQRRQATGGAGGGGGGEGGDEPAVAALAAAVPTGPAPGPASPGEGGRVEAEEERPV